MKNRFLLIAALLLFLSLNAQEWETDFETARNIASTENQPIILVFQGSDWCAPCIKLDREIWSTNVFQEYSKDHFVMLQADFPRKKKNALPEEQQQKNNILAEKYNKQGYFPFVVILDNDGNVLGEMGYEKISPQDYINKLEAFTK